MAWHRFSGIGDFARYVDGRPSHFRSSGNAWCGGLDWDETVKRSISGDPALVPAAEALLEQVEELSIETPRRTWNPSPFGAYPIVPEAIAGMPDSMRRQTPTDSDVAPLGVWVDVTASAMVPCDVLTRRGVAILALVLKLQQVRPVDLYLISALPTPHDTRIIITADSRPLDLATVCFALTNAGFFRRLCHSIPDTGSSVIQSTRELREYMEIPERDLAVKAAFGLDDLIAKDPVAWVNKHVEAFSGFAE